MVSVDKSASKTPKDITNSPGKLPRARINLLVRVIYEGFSIEFNFARKFACNQITWGFYYIISPRKSLG